jgi:CHAT domain-containing protein
MWTGPIIKEVAQGSSPQALADAGILDLVYTDRLDRAVEKLAAAKQLAPKDAVIASDLAAAYLQGGLERTQAPDLALSLDAGEMAIALDPSLPEAWFNVALARESLHLSRIAVSAWDTYLTLDSDSAWAKEARWHRQALTADPWERWSAAKQRLDADGGTADRSTVRGIVDAFPLPSRLYGEVESLQRWAAAQSRGDRQAAAFALAKSRSIGEILAARGDRMLADAIVAIDRAAHHPDKLAALASGHALYAEAAHLYAIYSIREARASFAAAARELARGGSPYHEWAVLSLAACDYQSSHYPRALARLTSVTRKNGGLSRYPSLAARAEWIRGLIAQIEAQPAAALESELAALAHFHQSSEGDSAGILEGLVAEGYGILGDDSAGWSHLRRSLAATSEITDRRSRQATWHIAAEACRHAGTFRAALRFEEEALAEARAIDNAVPITVGLCDVAELMARLGDLPAATIALASARAAALPSRDEALMAQVLLAEASALGASRRDAAIADLSAALPLLAKTHYALRMAAVYQKRGQLYAAAGRTTLAEADFKSGIERLDLSAGQIDPLQRVDYLDRSFTLWDEQVRLSARSERSPYAKTFCEMERAHSYSVAAWQPWRSHFPPTCDPAATARSLPNGATLIEYLVLPERVIAWVLHGGRLRSVELALPEPEVTSLVTSLRTAVERRGDAGRLPEKVYRALIAPLALPADASLLFIVPNKMLQEIPFAVLRNPASGQYLAEEHAIELLPSAGTCPRGPRARARLARPFTVLVIGDPALDRRLLPRLPDLPAAAAEAAAVGALYSGSASVDMLIGKAATKARVLAGLTQHSIVHLAAHAEADRRSPLLSRFFLAPSGNDPGVLFAHELYRRSFPATELVVLASCDTAAGALSPSAGVMSLARPFLAGGVEAVVANLWAVDDHAARIFSVEFHRRFADTRDAARALQEAQLHFIRSDDPALRGPAAWAGFVLAGGASHLALDQPGPPRRAAGEKGRS